MKTWWQTDELASESLPLLSENHRMETSASIAPFSAIFGVKDTSTAGPGSDVVTWSLPSNQI